METKRIVEILLRELHIPFTHSYVGKVFDRMPYSESLWAIHKILEEYNIANATYRINDKGHIGNVKSPFVAEMDSGFAVVTDVADERVTCKYADAVQSLPKDDFIRQWTGVLLEVDADEAAEPSYREHARRERWRTAIRMLTAVCVLAILGVSLFLYVPSLVRIPVSVLALLNGVGAGLSYLLIKKYLHIESKVASQLCSMFHQGDCNKTETENVRVMGIWDLSEIGLAYFSANLMALLASPVASMQVMTAISAVSLPFTVWSLCYQKFRMKKWCPLCVYVMVVFWVQFAVLVLAGGLYPSQIGLELVTGCIMMASGYVVLTFLIHRYVMQQMEVLDVRQKDRTLLDLKYNKKYWEAALHSGKHYELDDVLTVMANDGDGEKPQITVIGNPYCNPCAKMHERLDMLKKHDFSIQYILTVFNPEQIATVRRIIAAYRKDEGGTWDLLTDWYKTGRYADEQDFFSLQEADLQRSEVEATLLSQVNWIRRSKIYETPTVLVNGFKLPDEYQIEDLYYIY